MIVVFTKSAQFVWAPLPQHRLSVSRVLRSADMWPTPYLQSIPLGGGVSHCVGFAVFTRGARFFRAPLPEPRLSMLSGLRVLHGFSISIFLSLLRGGVTCCSAPNFILCTVLIRMKCTLSAMYYVLTKLFFYSWSGILFLLISSTRVHDDRW